MVIRRERGQSLSYIIIVYFCCLKLLMALKEEHKGCRSVGRYMGEVEEGGCGWEEELQQTTRAFFVVFFRLLVFLKDLPLFWPNYHIWSEFPKIASIFPCMARISDAIAIFANRKAKNASENVLLLLFFCCLLSFFCCCSTFT